MSQDTRTATVYELDLSTLGSWVAFNCAGMALASIQAFSDTGFDSAVINVRKSNSQIPPGVDYAVAKQLTVDQDIEDAIDVYTTEWLIAQVSTKASGSGKTCKLVFYATADPGAGRAV